MQSRCLPRQILPKCIPCQGAGRISVNSAREIAYHQYTQGTMIWGQIPTLATDIYKLIEETPPWHN